MSTPGQRELGLRYVRVRGRWITEGFQCPALVPVAGQLPTHSWFFKVSGNDAACYLALRSPGVFVSSGSFPFAISSVEGPCVAGYSRLVPGTPCNCAGAGGLESTDCTRTEGACPVSAFENAGFLPLTSSALPAYFSISCVTFWAFALSFQRNVRCRLLRWSLTR